MQREKKPCEILGRCEPLWKGVEWPPAFGRGAYPEEKFIQDLDAKTGSSLKLTILNPQGRVWTMVTESARAHSYFLSKQVQEEG